MRTLGKWHIGMKPGPIVYGERGEQVADCRSVSGDDAENSGNARLIAAAPDLLEACQTALANLKPLYASDHIVIRRLTAAIARAEGK